MKRKKNIKINTYRYIINYYQYLFLCNVKMKWQKIKFYKLPVRKLYSFIIHTLFKTMFVISGKP